MHDLWPVPIAFVCNSGRRYGMPLSPVSSVSSEECQDRIGSLHRCGSCLFSVEFATHDLSGVRNDFRVNGFVGLASMPPNQRRVPSSALDRTSSAVLPDSERP